MTLPKSLTADRIAVLSHTSPRLSGWLAERVHKTQSDYTEQYLTGGSRKRMPGHVVWYVTRANDGHVLGYVAANGEVVTDRPKGIRADTWRRVRDQLDAWSEQVAGPHSDILQEGLHAAGYDDADHADTGATFHLWERDLTQPVQEATVTRTFTDRHAAYLAMREADTMSHAPFNRPRTPENNRHAWISRTTEGE